MSRTLAFGGGASGADSRKSGGGAAARLEHGMTDKRDDKVEAGKDKTTGGKDEAHPDSQASLARLAEPDKGEPLHVGARLRNYFLTGLIVVGPVSITLYILWWFINLIDAWVKPLLPDIYNPETYGIWVPGVGLVFAIFAMIVIGALTANLFGRTLVSYGEMMLGRMPVVRNVYRALKQIFETVLSQSNTTFQKVALIEYPRRGIFSIVFISTETRGEISHRRPAGEGEDMLSVFLPTTPNPTSGYLLFVPRKDVIELDMTVEDAAKMVISAGLVTPEYQAELKELAEGARSGDAPPPPPPAEDADGESTAGGTGTPVEADGAGMHNGHSGPADKDRRKRTPRASRKGRPASSR